MFVIRYFQYILFKLFQVHCFNGCNGWYSIFPKSAVDGWTTRGEELHRVRSSLHSLNTPSITLTYHLGPNNDHILEMNDATSAVILLRMILSRGLVTLQVVCVVLGSKSVYFQTKRKASAILLFSINQLSY